MVEKQDKTATSPQSAPSVRNNPSGPDKQRARRDRQAQSLRENLLRRKAQRRGRTSGDDAGSAEPCAQEAD